jgi:hypothetical protein
MTQSSELPHVRDFAVVRGAMQRADGEPANNEEAAPVRPTQADVIHAGIEAEVERRVEVRLASLSALESEIEAPARTSPALEQRNRRGSDAMNMIARARQDGGRPVEIATPDDFGALMVIFKTLQRQAGQPVGDIDKIYLAAASTGGNAKRLAQTEATIHGGGAKPRAGKVSKRLKAIKTANDSGKTP